MEIESVVSCIITKKLVLSEKSHPFFPPRKTLNIMEPTFLERPFGGHLLLFKNGPWDSH